jgi:hypothetical protein
MDSTFRLKENNGGRRGENVGHKLNRFPFDTSSLCNNSSGTNIKNMFHYTNKPDISFTFAITNIESM